MLQFYSCGNDLIFRTRNFFRVLIKAESVSDQGIFDLRLRKSHGSQERRLRNMAGLILLLMAVERDKRFI